MLARNVQEWHRVVRKVVGMCGIAGILAKPALVNDKTLAAMAASLAHRGPDDQGTQILHPPGSGDLAVGLVHCRLSIIDLSPAGHQPMADERSGNWVVYNGEIYNHQELRRELENLGHVFRSQSDTEVIVKAYAQYGTACVERLRGMFAFAIWDASVSQFFLAVDRFGIKPLYVYQRDGLFTFASEIRTLLRSGLVPKEVEPRAVETFLSYGSVQAPFTMVKDVSAMLPGQFVVYDAKNRSITRSTYWQPVRAASTDVPRSQREVVARTREILADSVCRHLVSDVPVGLFLSGGIDSSAIVALANSQRDGALQSFSVDFAEDRYSEQKYSDLVAARYCRNHTRIRIAEQDLVDFLPEALEAMDQPTIDGINVYTISRAVRQAGIKVVLSGQGGDELFGGYPAFRHVPRILAIQSVLRHLPGFLRSSMGSLADVLLRQRWIGSKIAQLVRSDPDMLTTYLTYRQVFNPAGRDLLLHRRVTSGTVDGVPEEIADEMNAQMSGLGPFDCVSLLEMRLFMANTLLRDGDFMSMAHSLEIRVPFLDHRIAEFIFGVPSSVKSPRGVPKRLLVEAVGDLLPNEILHRRKMGFMFPWDLWLRQKLRSRIQQTLDQFPEDNGLGLRMACCRAVWEKFLNGERGVTWPRVWAIYVLLSWYRRNMESL